VCSGIQTVLGIALVSLEHCLDIRDGAIGCKFHIGSVVGTTSPAAPSVLMVCGCSSWWEVSVVYLKSATVNRVPCGTNGVISSWSGIAEFIHHEFRELANHLINEIKIKIRDHSGNLIQFAHNNIYLNLVFSSKKED